MNRKGDEKYKDNIRKIDVTIFLLLKSKEALNYEEIGNAILMIDIPFNIAGIILCMWRINIMLHSDLQRLIDEKGGIGAVNTLIVVGAVCCCMFLVLNIICAVGRARHKESMIAEGMTGISFLIKIMCIIFWAVYRLFL